MSPSKAPSPPSGPISEARKRIEMVRSTHASQLSLAELVLTDHNLLELVSELASLKHLSTLDLRSNKLTTLPEALGSLTSLTTLDLSDNQLTTLPETLGNLTPLTVLNLRNNKLTTLPETLGNLTALTTLDLSSNQLTMLPETLGNLKALIVLNLIRNQLTTLPETLGNLKALMALFLHGNQLTTLPDTLGNLTALIVLNLSSNELTTLPDTLGNLTALTRLDLDNNQLTTLPETLGKLTALTELHLHSNQLTTLPETLGNLTALTTLFLNNNQLTTLPATLCNLTALSTLFLYSNKLMMLPETLGNLKALKELYLYDNQLVTLPVTLGNLKALKTLSLHTNKLTTLPETLGKLTALTTLRLSKNQLTTLPETLVHLTSLTALFLHDNLALELPAEVLGPSSGECKPVGSKEPARPADILAFYFNLQQARRKGTHGTRRLNECKVLVLGQPQAGKTRLVGWLITGKDPGVPDHTDGIKIGDWPVPVKPGGEESILAHVWDFGGQEIMQATHSFFLTERALYILVIDGRTNEEQRRTAHWLERIRAFGKGSPVVMVLNKDDVPNKPPDMPQLKQDFGGLIVGDLHKTCAEITGAGIDALRAEVEGSIRALDNVNAEWPKQWLDAKDEIAAITAKSRRLSEKEYRDICKARGIKASHDQDSLLSQLVTLGTLHRYYDPRHSGPGDVFVLDPEWVTEGVYGILNSPLLKAEGGKLRRDRLGEYFKNKDAYPESDRKFILGAMTMDQFELAFEIPGRPGELLVPEALSTQTPPHGIDPREGRALNAVWCYRYLPDGVISRFTVRMHEKLEGGPGSAWKNGVVLRLEECRVLVRSAPEKNSVRCTVLGEPPRRAAALAVVRAMLESIHSAMSLKGVEEHVCAPAGATDAARSEEIGDPWEDIATTKRRDLEGLLKDSKAGPWYEVKLGGAWHTVAALLEHAGLAIIDREHTIQPGRGETTVFNAYGAEGITVIVGGDYIEGGKHMGNDNRIHIGGNVINAQVGQTLTNCTNMVNQQAPGKKKDLMDALRRDVEELITKLPAEKKDEAEKVAENLEVAIKQAAKDKPDRKWYTVSAEGLLEAATWVKDFSGQIGGTIKNLGMNLFGDTFDLPKLPE
jgi:internalin A